MKTDLQLQQDVMAELDWEASVNASDIGVQAKNGVVTLTGHIASYAEKINAERAAQRVAGVTALAIEMDVILPSMSKRNDADIALAVGNALQWSMYVPEESIKIVVEDGYVTLSGEVNWAYQRETAAAAVRYLMGVTGVNDQITVKPGISAKVLKSDIEAALKRRAHADAQKIDVAVHGADVTLTGTVANWDERALARNSAWGTKGVRNVIDQLTVA